MDFSKNGPESQWFQDNFFKCDLKADLGWPFLIKQYSKNSFKPRPRD
jgi:hypothetical protein